MSDEQICALAARLLKGGRIPTDLTDADASRLLTVGGVYQCCCCMRWWDQSEGEGIGVCPDCLLEEADDERS